MVKIMVIISAFQISNPMQSGMQPPNNLFLPLGSFTQQESVAIFKKATALMVDNIGRSAAATKAKITKERQQKSSSSIKSYRKTQGHKKVAALGRCEFFRRMFARM